LLDDEQVQNSDVLGDDATTARLTTALTLTATVPTETTRALRHEQEHALVRQHALLHPEALLVVATHDLKDVAFPFLSTKRAHHTRGQYEFTIIIIFINHPRAPPSRPRARIVRVLGFIASRRIAKP
jgi:hypothetical protein